MVHQIPALAGKQPVAPRAFRSRRGAEVLELVLALPVLIVVGLGIVTFGIFFSNRQQVALASRVGAIEASQTCLASTTTGDPVPANILDAITKHLESSCIEVYKVRLEHNANATATPVVLRWSSATAGTCDCGPDDTETLNCPILDNYVRLTVCVHMKELMPNCLSAFGFSLCDKVAQATNIYRHELDNCP